MERPKLYSGTKNASSWAMRAWLALREAGIAFDEEVVDIRRPQRYANLDCIGRFAPPAAVPVLVVGQHVIFDSLAIMEFANDLSGSRLLPEDTLARAAARSILAWQHSGLSKIAWRISFESSFYPDRRQLTEAEQSECAILQKHLEDILVASGGPYLFGRLSLADLALVPTIVRLSRHELEFSPWPRAAEWCDGLLNLASVQEWLAEADLLPHIWFDNYLIEGKPTPMAAATISGQLDQP